MVTTENRELTKAARFKRIAEKRTNRVLSSLRLIGQCSNKRSYEYTDAQVNNIFREIRQTLRETENKFRKAKIKKGFKL